MAIMNMRLWRKAYMLEFLDEKGSNEYFTFSVPPETEEFEFPQRVTETKTLGGSVFDDYGNDTISIQISGTTINEEKKMIYRGGSLRGGLSRGEPKTVYLTGEKEIFELQKLINDWGKGNKIPGKKIYLYDLSKMSMLQIASGKAGTPSRNYWRVVIKKLKIKRSKEKPNTYVYNLDMTGVEETERTLTPLFGNDTVNSIINNIQKTVEVIQSIVEATEFVADAIDETMQAANEVLDIYDALSSGDPMRVLEGSDTVVRNLIGVSPKDLYNKGKSLVKTGEGLVNRINGVHNETAKSAAQSRDDIFTVSFDSMGGSYVSPQKTAYSRKAVKPENPVMEKYAFVDWYTDEDYTTVYDFNTEITGNITLYAQWEQITATVSFNSRGGSPIEAQSVAIGETAAPPDPPPARNGYAFAYWCTDIGAENQFSFDTPVEGDITLYARWKTVYAVTFQSSGGSPVPGQIIDTGGKVIYPQIPIRENYIFGIWCTDSSLQNEYDFNSVVMTGFTLYAKWTQVSNTVTFRSNGGSSVPSQTVPIGGHAVKPSPDPVREGYTFIRWCGDSGLADEFIFGSTPVNYPVTIYASWQKNILTVSFNSNGGTEVESQEIEYGGLAVYPPVSEKAGSLFIMWYIIVTGPETDPETGEPVLDIDSNPVMVDTEVEYDFSTPVTENMTLHAKWYTGGNGA